MYVIYYENRFAGSIKTCYAKETVKDEQLEKRLEELNKMDAEWRPRFIDVWGWNPEKVEFSYSSTITLNGGN